MKTCLGPFKIRLDTGEWIRDENGEVMLVDGQDHACNLARFYVDVYQRSAYLIDKLTGTFVGTIRPEDVNWDGAVRIPYLNGVHGR